MVSNPIQNPDKKFLVTSDAIEGQSQPESAVGDNWKPRRSEVFTAAKTKNNSDGTKESFFFFFLNSSFFPYSR